MQFRDFTTAVDKKCYCRNRQRMLHQHRAPAGARNGACRSTDRVLVEPLARILPGVSTMNNQTARADALSEPQIRSSFLDSMLKLLLAILSSPRGDQGGWEGGARGLWASVGIRGPPRWRLRNLVGTIHRPLVRRRNFL
jgi:hypothetical protein